jgi:hypothetical protein
MEDKKQELAALIEKLTPEQIRYLLVFIKIRFRLEI